MGIANNIIEELERYKKINNYILEQEAELAPPAEPGAETPPAELGAETAPPTSPETGGETPPAEDTTAPVDVNSDPDVEKINNYILEQEAELAPPAEPGAETPPAEPGAETAPPTSPETGGETPPAEDTTAPVDVNSDPDVEKIGGEKTEESGSEELDITDLVNSQKNIETKQEEYFNNLFSQLSNLESKLGEMNSVIEKLNQIEAKIEKYREKTPQEKLELRSIDSGPFNQKLTDFFSDKSEDIEKSGKNEYILTTDEIEDYSPSEIKNTFNDISLNSDNAFKPIKF